MPTIKQLKEEIKKNQKCKSLSNMRKNELINYLQELKGEKKVKKNVKIKVVKPLKTKKTKIKIVKKTKKTKKKVNEYNGIMRYSEIPLYGGGGVRITYYGKPKKNNRRGMPNFEWLESHEFDKEKITVAEIEKYIRKKLNYVGDFKLKRIYESANTPEVLRNIGTAFQRKGVGPSAGQG